MNAVIAPVSWDESGLSKRGFEGFVTYGDLDPDRIPRGAGVYVVMRPGRTSTVPEIVFIGTASGLGGLRGRLRRAARRVAKHDTSSPKSGWQQGEPETLTVCWAATPGWDPEQVQEHYLTAYRERFGALPYVNERRAKG